VIETHISWVLLTGQYAYKIKKPVKLGFLDFSTLEKRRKYCEEELRVNRRTAPDLYLEVVSVGESGSGYRLGAEPAVEYAVRMRQFAHEQRLDRCLQAGLLGAEDMRRLAITIADFHRDLPPRAIVSPVAEVERAVRPVRNNFRHLDPARFTDEDQQRLAVVEAWSLRQAAMLDSLMRQRAARGLIRECHGDLHLENLLMSDGEFRMFDAIEFNPELRWIDIANDIAFLVMDLMARRRAGLAFALLNAWLEACGDYGSLAVMRFYLVYRSMVRAVVTSIRQQQRAAAAGESARLDALRYVELAAELVDTPPPRLLLMHGFSGSGKTWFSERLVGALPALRVRSDLERKRLAGRPAAARPGGGIDSGLYRPDMTRRTYEVLERFCETGLQAGFHMIADATFLHREQRARFFELAARLGVTPLVLDCTAPAETLRQRVRQRAQQRADASDADQAVLEHQLATHDPLTAEERHRAVRIDSEADPEAGVAAVVAAVKRD
jgi:aminoglycoside phosphotransferase family enzyme/predicted kinase